VLVCVVATRSEPTFTAPVAEDLAKIAVKAGASGIVAPATRPERVRRLRAVVGDLLILTPGAAAALEGRWSEREDIVWVSLPE